MPVGTGLGATGPPDEGRLGFLLAPWFCHESFLGPLPLVTSQRWRPRVWGPQGESQSPTLFSLWQ